jgi:tetratricopeptide (TPR) repeat protein
MHGELSAIPPGSGGLTIELSTTNGGVSERASVSGDGSFNLRSVQPGVYELRVYDGGAIVHQETVMIGSANQPLSIHLREAPSPTSTHYPNSTVSIKQLAHRPPPLARRAFEKGSMAEGNRDHEHAAEYFREAVTIDPEFADAYNELGAVDAARGNLPQALEDFQKAVNVVPEHPLALPNLSIVLAKLRRFHEAADVARRALQLSPGSGTLRYVLATSLYFEKGPTDEVLENLEGASSEVPIAYLVAARLLDLRGKRDEAVRHVETFLRVAPADDKDRDRAKAMLAELRP